MTDATRRAMIERIQCVLDDEVRPGLQEDGGDVELVGIDDDRIVQVRMKGLCASCPSTMYTFTIGIEKAVKGAVPEVRFLEAVP